MQPIQTCAFILFLFSFFLNNQVHGQKYFKWDWPSPTERSLWEEMQVNYKLPAGFEFCITTYEPNPLEDSVHYDSMKSADGQFFILIQIPDQVSPPKLSHPKIPTPSQNKDSLYLDYADRDMRTSLGNEYQTLNKCPIKHYSAKVAKKKFNADHALTYPLILRNPVERKELCQAIIIQKDKRGTIKLLCYYNKMSKSKFKKYIKMAEEVFYFRDPKDFVPYPKSKKDSVITPSDIQRN